MVFHWSQSDSKSSQVSRTLLSILADLNNVVVWMVFTRPLISKFSSPFNNLLVAVSSAPIKIGITITFMSHNLFYFLARFWYLSLFSPSVSFTLWSVGTVKFTIRQVLFSDRLAEIRWSVCISKYLRSWYVSFSGMAYRLGIYNTAYTIRLIGWAYTICSYG